MAFLQWRRFTFFEKEVVKDPEVEKLKGICITCSTSGRGQIIFGDNSGIVSLLTRNLHLSQFRAFSYTVLHLGQLRQNAILVSVGLDESGHNILIRLWNMDKIDGHGKPLCVRTIQPVQVIPSPVSAFDVHENLNLLSIGFKDSSILLVKGDLTRGQSKQKILKAGDTPVTGLAFRIDGRYTYLYAATENEVFSYNLSVKDKVLQLDDHGCSPKCAILSDAKQDHQFVIGRRDAVYFYQHDGRGPCLAFEGEKSILHWFRSYLVVVGKYEKPENPTAHAPSPIEMNVVTIYDIQNKFIAYSAPFPAVVAIVSEWGTLYVLSQDGKMFNLQEKDTQSKLNMLFRKNQYALAISLAKSQQYDEDGLIDIFRQYGDHLYSKGDHDGAIAQYIKTIGKLEASYVIRKFLDAQRIHNLTAYLQALHKKKEGLATEDHTTLLLNCYTKLKDTGKLDEFIKTKDHEIDFDIEIAMKVCRQAGYYEQALSLAERHKQFDWYLKIKIEDLKSYTEALDYISRLDFLEKEKNLKKYGKVLMNEVPEQTTRVLKELCSKSCRALPDEAVIHPEEFIHICVNNSDQLTEFLEHVVVIQPDSSHLIYNTLLELYLQAYNHETDVTEKAKKEKLVMKILESPHPKYDVDQALVLCEMNNFKQGILHLYEKSQLYQQVLAYHMDQGNYDSVFSTCETFGNRDPNLWVQALCYFSQLDESQKNSMIKVLNEIEKNNLLSPIMVIDIMANSTPATLDVVKGYIVRYLQNENKQIIEDKRLIQKYVDGTKKMRNQIEELRTSAKIFQVSKCSGCPHLLELPSVHFLCGHSYHQQCFESYSAENDSECPLCLPDNQKVLDIIKTQEQNKDLHEDFHHQLERCEDGFSVVADYFGRGVFNKVTLITDASRPAPASLDIPPALHRDVLLS